MWGTKNESTMVGTRKVRGKLEGNTTGGKLYRVCTICVPVEKCKDSYFSLIEMENYWGFMDRA